MPRAKRMKVTVVRRRHRRRKISTGLKRYIAKAVNRRIETKSIQYHESSFRTTGPMPFGGGVFYNLVAALNNNAGLDQGTGENNRIGDKVTCRGISLRIDLANHNISTSGIPFQNENYTPSCRIVVFKTKTLFPSRGTLMRNDSYTGVQAIDTDENIVLYDRIVTLHTTHAPSGLVDAKQADVHKLVKIWIKGHRLGFRGVLQFQDNSDVTLKGYNIFLGIMPYYPGDSFTLFVMDSIWNGVFYYKDA